MSEPLTVHQAMAAVMADVPAIAKNQKNIQQGYAARSVDDIYDALHGLFAKHGLFCLPRAGTAPGEFERDWVSSKKGTQMCHVWQVVYFDFYSVDGTGPLTMSARSEGRDAADKACNKAGSGAHKYALIQAFQIPVTGDTDPDLHHEEAQGDLSLEEQEKRGTNKLKAEALDLMGDADEAKGLFEKAVANVGMDWEEPVPVHLQDEVREKMTELAP